MKYNAKIDENKCDLCGECIELCSSNALTIKNEELIFHSDECAYCETCVDICENQAIQINMV